MGNKPGRKEGFLQLGAYKVWYGIIGDPEESGKLPLLCLHGGPGVPHDYLEPLEAIAETGRRVIFYDQLGCGNSDKPRDASPSLWTVDFFLRELDVVRHSLELGRFHLFGHSWGGMLAMEYALTKPTGLVSLILASSHASMPEWIAEVNRLRRNLPRDVQETLLKHEQAGTTRDPEYLNAMMVFYNRHLCRLDPWPECLVRASQKFLRNPEVYYKMSGPSEFHVTGVLTFWSIVYRLSEIRLPTLITSGRYDEMTPELAERLRRSIRGSEAVIFENSSHMAHIEEPEKYIQVLDDFLTRVERQARSSRPAFL